MPKSKIGARIVYIGLIIWALIQIFPIYWMFTFSLKNNAEIFGDNVLGLPKNWIWTNYESAITVGNIARNFFNSFVISSITVILTVIISLMACFALRRMIWRGRNTVNGLFMLGLTIPIHAAIVPVFIILSKLKMLNTPQSLIVPYTAFALAMAILIGNSFIDGLPKELEEAACIDGCSVYGIFGRIVLPFMKPALTTIVILTFINAWNELMFAVIFNSDSKFRTLPVGIQALTGAYTTEWGPIGAALVLATLPVLILYSLMSTTIQESLVQGAIKG